MNDFYQQIHDVVKGNPFYKLAVNQKTYDLIKNDFQDIDDKIIISELVEDNKMNITTDTSKYNDLD